MQLDITKFNQEMDMFNQKFLKRFEEVKLDLNKLDESISTTKKELNREQTEIKTDKSQKSNEDTFLTRNNSDISITNKKASKYTN